ncbi:hypothetical protein PAN31117_01710 [Pandoraea anapnoica]|uniref:Uncharacterized protein n=1 Tax=Pandoraea anapnoica TaxID=2508301 RepID=A0A5E4ZYC5_9BURK|nr:hypothetical protein [Pandoraea anapnoica]VVE64960.1 hypothetical protein PAN31117_01710 [Pandoraea anapnoica]
MPTSASTPVVPGYTRLFAIEVTHAYWTVPHLWLRHEATHDTAQWVRRRDLLVRPHRQGVAVFCASDRRDVLLDGLRRGDAVATFKWYAQDTAFSLYTSPTRAAAQQGASVYFVTSEASVPVKGQTLARRLHAQPYVDASDGVSVDMPSLTPYLERSDRVNPPVLVVQIDLADQVTGGGPGGVDYVANFAARESCWRYYYVCAEGDVGADALNIVDLDDKVSFVTAGREARPGGRHAVIFESEQAIAMQQQYPQRFQLRERGRSGERVLIRRLPNADIGSLTQKTPKVHKPQDAELAAQSRAVPVSEIYIN